MTVLTGSLGTVGQGGGPTGISNVANWSISRSMSEIQNSGSGSRGGTALLDGLFSWSGTFVGNSGSPVLMPRESFIFTGYAGPSTGVIGTAGPAYRGTAWVDSIALTWDWATAAIIATTYSFSGQGALPLIPAEPGLVDETDPDPSQTCAAKLQMADNVEDFGVFATGTDNSLDDVTTATLTITAANKLYANSGTTVVDGPKTYCTNSVTPGRINWTLAVARQRAEMDTQVGANKAFRIWIDDTEHWTLEWGKLLENSNLDVNIAEDSIIGFTENSSMNNVWTGSGRTGTPIQIDYGGGSEDIKPPALGRVWKPGDAELTPWFPTGI